MKKKIVFVGHDGKVLKEEDFSGPLLELYSSMKQKNFDFVGIDVADHETYFVTNNHHKKIFKKIEKDINILYKEINKLLNDNLNLLTFKTCTYIKKQSNSYINYLHNTEIKKYNQNINTVLELGAGAGHQARTLMPLQISQVYCQMNLKSCL